MKKLDTSPIVTGVGYPPSKKGFDFLYLSNQEILAALAQAIGGDLVTGTEVYALWGCHKTLTAPNTYTISVGYIYDTQDGEVYYYPGVVGLVAATAIIMNIDLTAGIRYPVAYNPVLFSDNTSKNVHVNNQLVAADGALGSGLINFADLIFVQSYYNKHTVGATGEPAYGAGFSGAGSVRFWKNKEIVTILVQYMKSTNVTPSGATIFTLPAGFRPVAGVVLAGINITASTAGVASPAALQIDAAGVVNMFGEVTNDYYYFSGSFPIN